MPLHEGAQEVDAVGGAEFGADLSAEARLPLDVGEECRVAERSRWPGTFWTLPRCANAHEVTNGGLHALRARQLAHKTVDEVDTGVLTDASEGVPHYVSHVACQNLRLLRVLDWLRPGARRSLVLKLVCEEAGDEALVDSLLHCLSLPDTGNPGREAHLCGSLPRGRSTPAVPGRFACACLRLTCRRRRQDFRAARLQQSRRTPSGSRHSTGAVPALRL